MGFAGADDHLPAVALEWKPEGPTRDQVLPTGEVPLSPTPGGPAIFLWAFFISIPFSVAPIHSQQRALSLTVQLSQELADTSTKKKLAGHTTKGASYS